MGFSIADIDRKILTTYLQYKFVISGYKLNNYDLHDLPPKHITVTSPNNDKWAISKEFYQEAIEYNKIRRREKSINQLIKKEL